MRNLLLPSLLLAAGCQGSEYGYQPDRDRFNGAGNTELVADPIHDSFVQGQDSVRDVLFVIDDSASMGNHQNKLRNNMGTFMDYYISSGADIHLGVTSTDMRETLGDRGQLIPAYGFPFIDKYTEEDLLTQGLTDANGDPVTPLTVMMAMAFLGVQGSSHEQGIPAAHFALTRYQAFSEANHGFLRDEAGLDVVFIADEDSSSYNAEVSNDEFITLLQQRQGDVQVHTIVGQLPVRYPHLEPALI